MGTVQPLEVVWLVVALVGFGFSVYNLLDSLKDLRAVDLLTNGNREVAVEVAGLSLRNEIARLILFSYLVMIGLVAMFIPPPAQPLEHPAANALISVLFVLMAITLVVKTTMTFFARRKIMVILQRQETDEQGAVKLGGRRRGDDTPEGGAHDDTQPRTTTSP